MRFDQQNFEAPSTLGTTQFFTGSDESHPVLINPISGQISAAPSRSDLGDEPVLVGGKEERLRHVRLSGDVQRDLWYRDTTLVLMRYMAADGVEVSIETAP